MLNQRYFYKDGVYGNEKTNYNFVPVAIGIHSTYLEIPTFVLRQDYFVHSCAGDVIETGIELMKMHGLQEICLVEEKTFVSHHLRKTDSRISILTEEAMNLTGPLYGMNLSCLY